MYWFMTVLGASEIYVPTFFERYTLLFIIVGSILFFFLCIFYCFVRRKLRQRCVSLPGLFLHCEGLTCCFCVGTGTYWPSKRSASPDDPQKKARKVLGPLGTRRQTSGLYHHRNCHCPVVCWVVHWVVYRTSACGMVLGYWEAACRCRLEMAVI